MRTANTPHGRLALLTTLTVFAAGALHQPANADDPAVQPSPSVPAAAAAYEPGDTATAAALAQAATGTDAAPLLENGTSYINPDSADFEVQPDGAALLTTTAGEDPISVTLAGTDAEDAVLADGVLVQPNATDSTDVVTRATSDGLQVLTIAADENAPDTFRYVVDLPAGGELVERPDGSVDVVAPMDIDEPLPGEIDRFTADVEAILGTDALDEELTDAQLDQLGVVDPVATTPVTEDVVVATAQPAWAVDANGDPVETSYEVVGNELRQHIETTASTAYPVVADPHWWFWAQCAAAVAYFIAKNFNALTKGTRSAKAVYTFAKSILATARARKGTARLKYLVTEFKYLARRLAGLDDAEQVFRRCT